MSSIGLFDSGIGGLTVLQQLVKTLPNENFIYFGDTARLPYGDKSRETIIRYSIENAMFLLDKNIKMLVVPCNTATAFALEELKKLFSIPIVGVIEPGVNRALMTTKNGRIGVIGTRGTISSQSYQKAILSLNPDAFVISIACPLFVPLVEENYVKHPAARLIVQEYLKPLKGQDIDTLLLGCTHYPLLRDLIQEEMGSGVEIVDSATACAEQVSSLLGSKVNSSEKGTMQFYVSDDPNKFQSLCRAFQDLEISHVELKNVSHCVTL